MIGYILAFLGAWYVIGVVGCAIVDLTIAVFSFKPWLNEDRKKKFLEECGRISIRIFIWPYIVLLGVDK